MKEHKFYNELPPMTCLAGDTIGPFRITLKDGGTSVNPLECSMRLIVADSESPTVAACVRECSNVGGVFEVTLTSDDTQKLNGVYELHFALYDASKLIHRKLYGTLHVKPVAKGGSV